MQDAQRLAKFEDQLRLFVEAVDPLLDQSPPNINNLSGGIFQKLKTLQQVIFLTFKKDIHVFVTNPAPYID